MYGGFSLVYRTRGDEKERVMLVVEIMLGSLAIIALVTWVGGLVVLACDKCLRLCPNRLNVSGK